MPRIPQAEHQVRPTGPGGGYIRANVGADAFGAAAARATQGFAQTLASAGGDMAERAVRMQAENNEAAAKAADVTFAEKARGLLFDPEAGFFNQKGKTALDGFTAASDALRKAQQEATSGLTNPEQQRLFGDVAARRVEGYLGDMQRHTAKERDVWLDTVSGERLESALTDAAANYNNPERLALYRNTALAEVGETVSRRGLGAEVQALREKEVVSKMHGLVVQRALAAGDAGFAQRYFAENAGEIDGVLATALQPMIEASAFKEEAQLLEQGLPVPVTPAAPALAEPMNVRGPVPDAIRTEAAKQGVSADLALRVASIESGFRPQASNGSSRGVYQMQPAAWKEAGGAPGREHDVGENITRGIAHLKKLQTGLRTKLGREPTDGEVYIAHQQGATGGLALITAKPGTKAVDALIAAGVPAAKAKAHITGNGGTADMTAAEFVGKWSAKVGGAPTAAPGPTIQLPAGEFTLEQGYAAIAAAKGDPKRYAALESSMKSAWTQRRQLKAEREERAFDAVQGYLQNPAITSWSQIPASVWSSLSPERQTSIMGHYAEGAGKRKTDELEFTRLAGLSASDPAAFARVDPLTYLNKLSPEDYQQVLGWRRDALKGATPKERVSVATAMSVSSRLLRAAGFNVSPDGTDTKDGGNDQAQKLAGFQVKLMREIDAFRARTGNEPEQTQIQAMADQLLLSGVLNGKPARLFEARPGQTFQMQIPADARARIVGDFTARFGRAPSGEEIVSAYKRAHSAGLLP